MDSDSKLFKLRVRIKLLGSLYLMHALTVVYIYLLFHMKLSDGKGLFTVPLGLFDVVLTYKAIRVNLHARDILHSSQPLPIVGFGAKLLELIMYTFAIRPAHIYFSRMVLLFIIEFAIQMILYGDKELIQLRNVVIDDNGEEYAQED